MPHGACWRWDPWVVWSNVLSDAAIALAYAAIGTVLIGLRLRRQDALINRLLELFGVFIFACGCTHAMEVYNTWHGAFRLAGLVKLFTAIVSCVSLVVLLQIAPSLLSVPSLHKALALDAELSSEKRAKHQVEGRLRESQDRFRLLVESIKDYAIVLLDPKGIITSWNPGAERIKGCTAEEVLGTPFSRFFTEEDLASGRPEEILRLAAAHGRIEEDGWAVRKDGTRFPVNAIITAFHDAQGNLQGYSNVTRDITQQRAAQAALRDLAEDLEDRVNTKVQELRESEARLQGFIHHANAAIYCKGPDGRFLLLNPRMEAIFGRPAKDILGRTNGELSSPERSTRLQETERRVLERNQESRTEEEWIHGDGSRHDYLVHKFPLVDAMGRCWGLGTIATDLTEHKRAERALLESQKLESLGVLAGGLAHDFNNLLGAMQGNVELALSEPTLDLVQPYLETLKQLMAKAADLLRQMLTYAGQGSSRACPLDLNGTVADMTHLLRTSISKKAVINLDLNPEPLILQADPTQLQQVVMNLVLNASEALNDRTGSITIRTRQETLTQHALDLAYSGQALRAGTFVSLEVVDTGIGMAPEVLKRIFDPFFTTKFTGRGLGLASIHGIVRTHQGGILVASSPGEGSTFKFLFPVGKGPVLPMAPAPQLPSRSTPEPSGVLVLVVDDERPMREVVVRALGRAGFRTLEARDGLEAVAAFKAHQTQIGAVLMDLTMPNMDGEEACRELRRERRSVPVILTSGFNEAEARHRFQDLQLAGFIQKPFGLGALVALVRKVTRGADA
jgi:PAS domain S-box-containing protein